ncbi:ankyrin repeat domain-containing protein [Nocardioides sp. NPDC006273]|uniref:ankyrin repeat domain-containing protein n=1 Tax=Nocardioides sp. NPDC006273 TaxID=3155598 RepID=UPI0033B91FD2
MTPAHLAVEHEDLPALRDLLDHGTDLEEVDEGMTLLQHTVEVEIDGHIQSGDPLRVDVTAYLLARGADPLASALPGIGSALHMAQVNGHWLAVALIEAQLRRTTNDQPEFRPSASCGHR